MIVTEGYVFSLNPDHETVLAGRIGMDGQTGWFVYDPSWLRASWAYALDPVNLPLSERKYTVNNSKGVFPIFQDAGPDDWGTYIALMNNTSAPQNELERLIRTNGGGVGCIRFSLSRSKVKGAKPLPKIADIDRLKAAIESAVSKQILTPEEIALIEPGSSIGGARPKLTCVDDNGRKWILKFAKNGEQLDIPRLEYASMTFIRDRLGLNVPDCELIELSNGKSVFKIARFDENKHFASAYSLINQDRVREIRDAKFNPYSYIRLAGLIRKHAKHFESDLMELFRRMVVNIVIGNTDDHARNHAFLYDIANNEWGLSPAYDMLPSIKGSRNVQALGVGKRGNESSIENALSYYQLFGLKEDVAISEARFIVDTVKAQWRDHLKSCGIAEVEIGITEKYLKVS
jgi:serine/threonine-protein kinase HipA